MKLARFLAALVLVFALCSSRARADVKLPTVFSDHMVLQRDKPVPIWGQAQPGQMVTVKFREQTKTATADAKGKWLVKLDPLTAGGPDVLTVSDEKPITIKDVLVGEVWVGSGQSNMELPCRIFVQGDPVLAAMVAAAPYPGLRIMTSQAKWQEATSTNLTEFSALLFAFGWRLQIELGVPVGLMLGAASGTPSGPWLSEEALKTNAACQKAIQEYSTSPAYLETVKKYEKDLADWKQAGADVKKQPAPLYKPGEMGLDAFGRFGGGKIGYLYEAFIHRMMPYAIRGVLWDQGESGTAVVGVDSYTLMGALIRGWRTDWGEGDFPFIYVQKPSGWGCTFDYKNRVTNKGDHFVPLPEVTPDAKDPNEYIRVIVEQYIRIMTYPNVGMAIASDLGGGGLHATNKSGYGHRAADVALGMVYNHKIEYYGPIYASHKIEGATIRVSFSHVGQGLTYAHGDKLQGFAIAGPDHIFHWADARIDGDTVVLSSAKVPQPIAAWYGWSGVHMWANFFNKDGLPAIPFRTDVAEAK